jgi:choline dehydrogenase-like flavoprotein
MMSTPYDAIIIGTGAGGGTLAFHLAQAGKNILILEQGPSLTIIANAIRIADHLLAERLK